MNDNIWKNITPPEFACSLSMACPSIHISGDGERLRIAGAMVVDGELDPIAYVETVVDVSTDMVMEALLRWRQNAR